MKTIKFRLQTAFTEEASKEALLSWGNKQKEEYHVYPGK
jgi:hypothetical protein